MSDLERAMNPGGLPGPVPSQGEDHLGEKPPKKARKKRVAKKKVIRGLRRGSARAAAAQRAAKAVRKRAPRGAAVSMDLAGTMELLGSMHRTDVPVFQVISEALSSRAKPSRKRLLAAIAKVFG